MQSTFNAVKNKVSGAQRPQLEDMRGMTALVTGGTGGIGFEVAKALAISGARVLLLSRKAENGGEAIEKIREVLREQSQNEVVIGGGDGVADRVTFVSCDLGNLAEVKKVGDEIRKEEKRMDVFVADAGIGVNKFGLSHDSIERHFAVNHLGHFLLLNRLFPLIQRTSLIPSARPPRVIAVASELHRAAWNPSLTSPSRNVDTKVQFSSEEEITPETEEEQEKLSPHFLYARSKLANILFIKDLYNYVIKPNNLDIITIATHPGAVHTGQQDQFKEAYGPLSGRILKALTVPFMRNPEQGSHSTVWAATSPDVDQDMEPAVVEGESKLKWQSSYITDPKTLGAENEQVRDTQLAKNLWTLSERLITEKLGAGTLGSWVEK